MWRSIEVGQLEINIFKRLESSADEAIIDQIAMYRTMPLKESLSSSLEGVRSTASKVINFVSRKTVGKDVLTF